MEWPCCCGAPGPCNALAAAKPPHTVLALPHPRLAGAFGRQGGATPPQGLTEPGCSARARCLTREGRTPPPSTLADWPEPMSGPPALVQGWALAAARRRARVLRAKSARTGGNCQRIRCRRTSRCHSSGTGRATRRRTRRGACGGAQSAPADRSKPGVRRGERVASPGLNGEGCNRIAVQLLCNVQSCPY
jgi:hypothetical protein